MGDRLAGDHAPQARLAHRGQVAQDDRDQLPYGQWSWRNGACVIGLV
jgi:hypothetical protein